MKHQGKAVWAVGRHRADIEDKQHVGTQVRGSGQQKPDGLRPRRESRRKPRQAQRKPAAALAAAEQAAVSRKPSALSAEPSAVSAGPVAVQAQTPQPGPRQKNHDLLLWGIFLAVTAVGAMTWAEIDWRVTAAVAFLLLLSFAAVWQFSSNSPAVHNPTAQSAPDSTGSASGPAGSASAGSAPAGSASAEAAPTGSAPAGSASGPAPKPPITRKEMRAADPTTGVLPVVSVFARKPGAGSGRPSARTAPGAPAGERSTATKSGIPLAPAGHVLQGIDTGQGKPAGRKARRRAEASDAAAKAAAPVQAPKPAPNPAPEPAKTGSAKATETVETAEPNSGNSRWTRTFGPPETGQLPVQQYDAAAAAVAPSEPESADRRQRSHSSL